MFLGITFSVPPLNTPTTIKLPLRTSAQITRTPSEIAAKLQKQHEIRCERMAIIAERHEVTIKQLREEIRAEELRLEMTQAKRRAEMGEKIRKTAEEGKTARSKSDKESKK